jgi:hypothetical protein
MPVVFLQVLIIKCSKKKFFREETLSRAAALSLIAQT